MCSSCDDSIKNITPPDTKKNLSVWNTEGQMPKVYAQVAYSILSELPNKAIWPTPGNVIALLGKPSGCNVNGYQGDVAPRLDLWYKSDKVSLGFSICGLIESVVYSVKPQERQGWEFTNFKKSIPSSQWPYISGVFRTIEPPNELKSKALELSESLKTEGDWYPVIMRHFRDYSPPVTPEGLATIPCKSKIMIIDGLRNDLAIITFSIKGQNQYWCDTWWHFENEKWHNISPHEGGKLIERTVPVQAIN